MKNNSEKMNRPTTNSKIKNKKNKKNKKKVEQVDRL